MPIRLDFRQEVYEEIGRLVSGLAPSLSFDESLTVIRRAHRETRNNTVQKRKTRTKAFLATRMVSWQLPERHIFAGWVLFWLAEALREKSPSRNVDSAVYLPTLVASGLVGSRAEERGGSFRGGATARTPYWLAAAILGTLLGLSPANVIAILEAALFDMPSDSARQVQKHGRGIMGRSFGYLFDKITRRSYTKARDLFQVVFSHRMRWEPQQLSEKLQSFEVASEPVTRFWKQSFIHIESIHPHGTYARHGHEVLFHAITCGTCLNYLSVSENCRIENLYLPMETSDENNAPNDDPTELGRAAKEMCEADERRAIHAEGRAYVSVDGGAARELDSTTIYFPKRSIELFLNGASVLWHEVIPNKVGHKLKSSYRIGLESFFIEQDGSEIRIRQGNDPGPGKFRLAFTTSGLAVVALLFLIFLIPPAVFLRAMPVETIDPGSNGTILTDEIEVVLAEAPLFPVWLSRQELELTDSAGKTATCRLEETRFIDGHWSWKFGDCSQSWWSPESRGVVWTGSVTEYRFGWIPIRSSSPGFRIQK